MSIAITSNNADVTVSPNPVVLNSSNWADGVAVTVSTRQDADGVNDVVTLSHVATSVSGGQAGDYDGASIYRGCDGDGGRTTILRWWYSKRRR